MSSASLVAARRRAWSRFFCSAACAGLMSTSAVGVQGAGLAQDETAQVLAALANYRAGDEVQALRELEHLGAHGVEAIFHVLAGRELPAGVPPAAGVLGREDRTLLMETLRTYSPELVIEAVLRTVGDELGERLLAIELIGHVGTAGALDPLLEVFSGCEAVHRQHPLVVSAFESALEATLRRDLMAYGLLSDRIKRLDARMLPGVARALGAVGSEEGLTLLEGLIGRDATLDLAVLEALGRMQPWTSAYSSAGWAGMLHAFLSSADEKARRQAAVALGRLGDVEAVPGLIELLGDSDAHVRSGSLWALREISKLNWQADPERWSGFFERERIWFTTRKGALGVALQRADPARAVAALSEISAHSLYGRRLTTNVSGALSHANDNVAIVACATLRRLQAREAVPALVLALDDERLEVRGAALEALSALTGQALPADRAVWLAWLEA